MILNRSGTPSNVTDANNFEAGGVYCNSKCETFKAVFFKFILPFILILSTLTAGLAVYEIFSGKVVCFVSIKRNSCIKWLSFLPSIFFLYLNLRAKKIPMFLYNRTSYIVVHLFLITTTIQHH